MRNLNSKKTKGLVSLYYRKLCRGRNFSKSQEEAKIEKINFVLEILLSK